MIRAGLRAGLLSIAALLASSACVSPDPDVPQLQELSFPVPCSERSAQDIVIPTRRIDPIYPPAAAARGIEGFVVLRIVLDGSGGVTRAEVTEAQPPGVFDAAGLEAIRRWRFCAPSEIAHPYKDPHEVKLVWKLNR